MAFIENASNRSYPAASAVTQFRFVTMGSTGVAHTGAGLRASGVALASAAAGGVVPVAYDGRVSVVAAGTISRGASVASNASGQAVAATTGNIIVGTAYEDAVAGQIMVIDIRRDSLTA